MDMERLEKLDIICERMGVSYGEADAALEKSGGDVVKAIIYLENEAHYRTNSSFNMDGAREEFIVKGNELVDKVKELIKKGNVTRVIVKNEEGKTLVEIPMTVGVVGTVIAPTAAILGGLAALLTRCRIVVERPQTAQDPMYAFAGDPNNEEVD